jgi:hypothetical protein
MQFPSGFSVLAVDYLSTAATRKSFDVRESISEGLAAGWGIFDVG